jgi:queuine tRNA-ribosyltransferase
MNTSRRRLKLDSLETLAGIISLPSFLPDATRGIVRTIDSRDIRESGIKCLMVNTIHLSSHPGISVINALGGIHKFMAWDGPIFSDSGGFQVFSLIDKSASLGSVTRKGFVFRLTKGGKKRLLTPEKSIEKQLRMGADIMFCLDYCTHPQADYTLQLNSVEITIDWAQRCKKEFETRVENRGMGERRPLLFAVIQGGNSRELRKMCAERLIEIGFDGYGYGGWPIDSSGNLVEAVEYTAGCVPGNFPLFGLGIGKPENIVHTFQMGVNIFDCVLPTRDARHQRLYVYNDKMENIDLRERDFYDYLYIQDSKFVRDSEPVEPYCDCFCCRNYSRAYLHHLMKIEDPLVNRLATIHNLRFYARLMEKLPSVAVKE